MKIVCPACRDEIGDTSLDTVDEAIAAHVCEADSRDYFKSLDWVRLEQVITAMEAGGLGEDS